MGVHNGLGLSWDETKRAQTLRERGLDFADAETVLMGRQFTRPTHGGKTGETRFVTAGFLGGRMVVLVWNAHAKEQRLWEQKMGRPR